VKTLIIFILLMLAANSAFAQTATPVPPTPTPIPFAEIPLMEALATQNANGQELPTNLEAPNGVPLLPATDGREVFGYVKWLVSPVAAQELFGPFATIFTHIGLYIVAVFSMMSVYGIVYALSWVIRWVVFLYKLIAENVVFIIIVTVVVAVALVIFWIANFISSIL
jgi:hypothetical protein